MRAAFVTCGGFDDLTGAGVYDRRLAGHLRERGDTVDVVSLPRRCYARSLGEGLSGGLAGTLAGGRYDAIIEDEQDHPSLLLLNRRLRRRAEGPIVAIVHRLRCRGRCPGAARLIFRRIEKLYLDSTDGIVCDSEIAHRAAGTQRPGRPAVRDRRAGGGRAADLRVLFVGNVIRRKGLHVLVDALASLPPVGWRLDVVGSLAADSRYAAAVRRQIAERGIGERICFRGVVGDGLLARILDDGHVLVVPSIEEGSGMVSIEAFSRALPVIASRAGGAAEVVSHGRDGFLVDPGDAAMIASYLELLMENRGYLRKVSTAAGVSAARFPTWAESAEAVSSFIRSL